jgi:retron-type reverse transcriptase
MPTKHDGLFARVANFQALLAAAKRAIRGKRKKPGGAAFMANLETELLSLERELRGATYKPGRYVKIELFDPKHRIVSAAPFRDRVVHHALCDVVDPIFASGFIAHSFANQTGKGTHRAVAAYERYRDRHAHVLRCDIFRYFPAIDHAVLKHDFRRRIACSRTLTLMDKIVDGSNPQEPVNLHFPGDDLFAPFQRRRGLPIGNLTSQFFANLYLDPLDHYVTEVLRAPYVRYVDDFALFHDDPHVLDCWRGQIANFLEVRIPRKRLSWRLPRRPSSWDLFFYPAGGVACPREISGAFAIVCGRCAISGEPEASNGETLNNVWEPGLPMLLTPIHGACAMRSSRTGGLIRHRGLDSPLWQPRSAWRFLEQ